MLTKFFTILLVLCSFYTHSTIILDATSYGRTNHNSDFLQTFNDHVYFDETGGFRVFDLSNVNGHITSASLNLGSTSTVLGTSVDVVDFLGDSSLLFQGSNIAGTRLDLISGSIFGTFSHNFGINFIQLNSLGLDYLNAHRGGLVTFGLHASASAFGYGLHNTQQLSFETTTVPEPNILVLMGLGLLGMFGVNRRKAQA